MSWKSIKALALSLFILSPFSVVNADVFDLWEQGKVELSPDVEKLFKKDFKGKNIKFLDRTKKREGSTIVRFYDANDPETNGWFFVDHTDTKITFLGYTTFPPPKSMFKDKGQLADVVTTGAGLAAGFVEMNPIPVPILLPGKLIIDKTIKSQSFETCFTGHVGLTVPGYAAAGWNIGMIAFGGPVAIIPAVALAYAMFPDINERLWACAGV